MENRFTIFIKACGAVGHQSFALRGANRLAQVGFARQTILTLAAFRGIKRNHMIANLNAGNAFANGFHNTTAFVAENGRKYAFRIFTRQRVGIGMADAGGDDAHQHFAFLRWHQINFFNFQRLTSGPGNSGTGFNHFHFIILFMA